MLMLDIMNMNYLWGFVLAGAVLNVAFHGIPPSHVEKVVLPRHIGPYLPCGNISINNYILK